MFVKVYSFHIKPGKENDYIRIQKEANKIYSSFVDKQTILLKSEKDASKWIEIHTYKDTQTYEDSIKEINNQVEIQVLFKEFLEVIDSKEELNEENFKQIFAE